MFNRRRTPNELLNIKNRQSRMYERISTNQYEILDYIFTIKGEGNHNSLETIDEKGIEFWNKLKKFREIFSGNIDLGFEIILHGPWVPRKLFSPNSPKNKLDPYRNNSWEFLIHIREDR